MRTPAGNNGSDRTRASLSPDYDVAILGGGPAGFATALSLRRRLDVRVLVAEVEAPGQVRIGESCPPDIILPLGRLGLETEFRDSGHAPCPGYASSWGRPGTGYNDFLAHPLGHGWRLNRRAFDRMLATAAEACGVEVAWRTRFRGAEPATRGGYRLQLSEPGGSTATTKASFVVDATGSQARFARALGIRKRLDDRLFARVRFARVVDDADLTHRVMLEATPEGWWYAAAVPERWLVTMVVGEEDAVRAVAQGEGAGYERALNATSFVGPALAELELAEVRYRAVPVRSGILEQTEGAGWLAVGDAASSYDPVMAQGIHKALSDGIEAAEAVGAHLDGGEPPDGSYARHVEESHGRYLEARAHVYGLEQRWPDAPFWRNRHRVGRNPP